MSRAAPKQQRSKDTVARILTAANALFAGRGSAGVTTTQIAEAAGVSVGALYRFFPDKRSIGEALAAEYLDAATERFAAPLAAVATLDDVPAALRDVIAIAGELALEHPGYYRLTAEVRPDDADSIGHGVRIAMIDAFDELLVGLGASQPGDVRRAAVTMAIETVRHTLATCPTEEPMRRIVLSELADMVVTYAERRLASR